MKVCPQCETEYELDQKFCSKDGATLRPKAAQSGDLVGSIVADRYQIQRKLGEGGMGQVYLAQHVRIGRKSALKVMHPNMLNDAESIGRFTREATNASRIDHPNVAAIYDFGETGDGLVYLAMEFVEGAPLQNLLDQGGALEPKRVADIVAQTAGALQAAHDLGIVHRDLKPDNIMVARNRDGSDKVKVVDFGIAKVTHDQDQKVTQSGILIGTPAYMSPEQVGGDKLDGRSDLYALALVAYKCLTGNLPFAGETTYEAMASRLTDKPRSLAQLRPDVQWPEGLEVVLRTALAMKPSERYPSVSEFATAFAQAVQGLRVSPPAEAATMIAKPGELPMTRKAPVEEAKPAAAVPATAATPARKSPLPMAIAAAALLAVGGGAFVLLDRGAGAAPEAAAPVVAETVAEAEVPAGGATVDRSAASATPAPASTPQGAAARQAAPQVLALSNPNVGAKAPVTGAAPAAQPAAQGPAAPVPSAPQNTAASAPLPAAAVPAAPAAPDFSSDIRRLGSLVSDPDDDARNEQAIVLSRQLLAKVGTRGDSALVLMRRGQAEGYLARKELSCQTLARAISVAKGTPLAGTAVKVATAMDCGE